jgi:hypothetical protein
MMNLTQDGHYGRMLRLVLDYSAAKPNSGTWTITNPKVNAALHGAEVNDLIIIVHYEVSLT